MRAVAIYYNINSEGLTYAYKSKPSKTILKAYEIKKLPLEKVIPIKKKNVSGVLKRKKSGVLWFKLTIDDIECSHFLHSDSAKAFRYVPPEAKC